jgi:hypothetical protein
MVKNERLEDMAGIYGDREGLEPHEPWRFFFFGLY